MLGAQTLCRLARDEIIQLRQEGCDTTVLEELLEACEGAADSYVQGRLTDLFEMARRMRPGPDFPYDEPSDLAGIREAAPKDAERWTGEGLAEDWVRDRLTGAWLGRCVGCMMGKPVEGKTRGEIELILRAADAYPLEDYFPVVETPPEGVSYSPASDPCLAPNIDRAVRDDDTDYTVLGLMLMEEHGPDFSPGDVAHAWLSRLPFLSTYTAERAAMRNLINELPPPETARWMNPYREWIGAQIRADGLAYCAPGQPELAATWCHRDASISHTKNGIYGEMFFGALIAAALGAEHLEACIQRALAEIPENCRLASAVRTCVEWCAEDGSWEDTWKRIMADWGDYHAVHTINNALLCVMALLHGKGDVRRSIAIAVMSGLDTDCNGATVGSVLGALRGSQAIPVDLAAPLSNTLETALSGVTRLSISDLVERSVAVAMGGTSDGPAR
ncbi:MAG: ADP-ribosylglycohydrolase family protein [Armatimonadota bacterium]|jgi:ADP-ribosylglycohydrolase